ncbi:hypothetical protein VPH35_130852 [Triticum aestivum]
MAVAALVRSSARHRPAVAAALLRSTAALPRSSPAPTNSSAALLCPRRLLSGPARAQINTEICRVEAAIAARYDSASKRVDELSANVNKLGQAVAQQDYNITLNLGETSFKVAFIVLNSAVLLGLGSYTILYTLGGRSARAEASALVEGKVGELEAELVNKIEGLYKDQEKSNSEARSSLNKREAANKAKELDLIARERALQGGK